MTFGCLNVNGLKGRLFYPEFIELINDYDVLCVCDTHLDNADLVDIENYTFFSKNRSQSYKRKSGGIGIYVKNTLVKYFSLVENVSEYVLWMSICKDFTKTDENSILGVIYIPPENSRFLTEEQFTILENEISEKCINNKYVYLTGDTNSRVGSMSDYVPSDPHLDNIFDIDYDIRSTLDKHKILESLSVNPKRKAQDNKTNTNGFKLLDICKNNNLFFLNGRMFLDKNMDSFTFRGKSTSDYVMASADCFTEIAHFEIIETDRLFSDGHSLLSWHVRICKESLNPSENQIIQIRPNWVPNMHVDFYNNLNQEKIHNISSQLNTITRNYRFHHA